MNRQGFSLIEVILSTALLLGSVIVLNELAGIGRRQSQRAATFTEAHSKCHQLMVELVSGLRPLEFAQQEPYVPLLAAGDDPSIRETDVFGEIEPPAAAEDSAEDAEWLYSVIIEPDDRLPGLVLVTVVVEQAPERDRNPARSVLRRWVRESSGQLPVDGGEFQPQDELTRAISTVAPEADS